LSPAIADVSVGAGPPPVVADAGVTVLVIGGIVHIGEFLGAASANAKEAARHPACEPLLLLTVRRPIDPA
jgi:hypothetical protein